MWCKGIQSKAEGYVTFPRFDAWTNTDNPAEDAARAAGTEHLKQQVMMLHHQLNAARARLGEPPVDLPPLVPPEGFEASAECLGLGLDFQGAESDGSMEFT